MPFLAKALRGVIAPTSRSLNLGGGIQMEQARPMSPQPAKGEARGTVSGFVLGVSPLWGQPYPEQASNDVSAYISRQRMREIVLRTPTASASVNAILDFSGGVKVGVRNIDPSKPTPKIQAGIVNRLLNHPNSNQTKRQFLQMLMRDMATFGYGAIELVPTGNPTKPVDMWVMDSARLKIDFDEHGFTRGYDMLDARGVPIIRPGLTQADITSGASVNYDFPQGTTMGYTGQVSYLGQYNHPATATRGLHGWEPDEVMFFSQNPITESVYPHSRIVQLFSAAVLEDLMMQFISERFTDSNIPFGVMDLGDLSEMELRTAIDNWNTQGQHGSRIVLTGSRGSGTKFIPFGYHLKDLEATQLLGEIRMKIMGVLGVTMQELGESQDVNKANGYNLSFTFKKRAVEPMLDEITETLTKRLLWDTLGYHDLELYYDEIDSRDDLLQAQIDTAYMKLAILSPNEIRNRKGLVSVPGGEDKLLYTGNSWMPIDLARQFAEEIIKIEAQTTAVGVTGPEGTRVRENVANPSQPKSAVVTHSNASSGKTPPHAQGKPSQMARLLSGKGLHTETVPSSNGHSSSKLMSWGNRYPYDTDWIELGSNDHEKDE